MRDLDRLRRMAAEHGPAIGAYADALLDIPLPWTKMRQVYALLGLVKKWGASPRRRRLRQRARTRAGQRRAHRPHARARHRADTTTAQPSLPGVVVAGRFARDPGHFAVARTAEAAR